MARTTREMSDKHESFLAALFKARRTPGSGNGFANQTDVRNDARRQSHAFAVDGKSTFAKSITVKVSDLDKVADQAHNEQPAMALRFYADETLKRARDWILIEASDFEDLLQDARAWRERVEGGP